MPALKKSRTTKSKSTARLTKKSARVNSVTKKLENSSLLRSLNRRQQFHPQTVYDLAIPQELRQFVSVANEEATLSIQSGEHNLSPFIVNLRHDLPSPQELLEDHARVRLNLLDQSLTKKPFIFPVVQNALTLQKTDIHFQLKEDLLLRKLAGGNKQEARERPEAIEGRKNILSQNVLLPGQELISMDAFLPKKSPEDIFSYFDLPEEEPEQTDESELVELEAFEPVLSPSSPLPRLNPFAALLRPVGVFVLISFIFVLPLHAMNVVTNLRQTKSEVETVSKEGFSFLQSGADATIGKKSNRAERAFSRANERFSHAKQSLSEMGLGASLLLSAIPTAQKNLATGKALLSAGEHLTTAGTRVAEALDALAHETQPTPVSRIRLLQSYLSSIVPHLVQANDLLTSIEPDNIPEAQRETFTTMQLRLPTLIASLSEFDELANIATNILGADSTKRYLLVFQNNTEIRSTGGFMGSFAEVKVRDGILEHLSVPGGGTYDLQGFLRQSRIVPRPLQLLNARWEFQDANWFPDFPTSARQMIEFYRDAGGPSVDGVIAVNATYVADLIGLLGPIEMENYGRTIDQENFLFEAQKIVELEYDQIENKPKQFIGDLAPKLVERALEGDPEQFLVLIDHLSTGFVQKDVQLYFTDEEVQKTILMHGWGGAIKNTSSDYLMVVDSNLGGGKTDGVISEKIDVAVHIEKDGSITNTVSIDRTHHGIPGVVFTGVNNVDYLRVYVPKGSELLSASGFSIPDDSLFERPDETWLTDDDLAFADASHITHEQSRTDVYEEHGKTVFGNWVQTQPGSTSHVEFMYRLPFTVLEGTKTGWIDRIKTALQINQTVPYSITLQKQSGILDRATNVTVTLPDEFKTIWKSSENSTVSFDNTTDGFFGLLLQSDL